jgi:type III pantothenate kinase
VPERRARPTPTSARRKYPARKNPRRASSARGSGLLTVDIGNSDTVVGLFRGARLTGFWRLTSGRLTADEAMLLLQYALGASRGPRRGTHASRGSGAVLCSVVPRLTPAWSEALERMTGRAPLEVTAELVRELLPIRYHDPSAVGADRIANALAARELYGAPVIVVDLGTATTFDCVSAEGAYLGGAISPGVGTSAEELFRRAARVPRVDLRRPKRALGRTTEESLRSGVLWGAVGQVDALVRRLAAEMKGKPRVIATGGWAKVVAPECETVQAVDEALTLKGMRLLWEVCK